MDRQPAAIILITLPTLLMIRGLEFENVTSNLGLLPIRLGSARMINHFHTITHYYQLGEIVNQVNQIKAHFQDINKIIEEDSEVQKLVQSRIQMIEHMLKAIEGRLFASTLPRRQKRGLLNGLGSVVKFITGNLDANDEEKFNQILHHLHTNQEILSQQISHHYSINEKFVTELNETILDINYNHDILASEIERLKEASSFATHVGKIENALEHNQLLLQIISDLTQDIENSITFCKLGKLHPSIIKPETLQQILRNLIPFYGNNLPLFEGESLWEIQNHIKVKCFISSEEIIYFLDVPILHTTHFDLILLQPIPTFIPNFYATILPTTKYALKSTTDLRFLKNPCEYGRNYYLCQNSLQLTSENDCELDILTKGLNGRCDLIQLDLQNNHIELLEEANRYVFLFPYEDQIKIIDQGNIQFKSLLGIFLVSPGNSTIEYRNQTLTTPSTYSSHTPSMVMFQKQSWDFNKKPTALMKLRTLKQISQPSIPIPSTRELVLNHLSPSAWTILLYVALISFFTYTGYRFHKHRRNIQISRDNVI